MSVYRACLICFTCLTLFSCASVEHTQPQRSDSPYISQQLAEHRAARVSEVSYQIHLTADGSDTFSSNNRIEFTLTDTLHPLTLDVSEATIHRLRVNGHWLYPKYNGAYLSINPKMLVTGNNIIEINYTRLHSTNGEGWHRFVDPVDQQVYLYSHFEPAAAQQMFALFDQPDIKAQYQLTVTVPADWQVVSAMRETRIDSSPIKSSIAPIDLEQADTAPIATKEKGQATWHFPKTPKLSSYNFSVHAGPYHVWHDHSAKYPLRLFARQSVAAQVTPEDWFTYTRQGLDFFEQYFAIDYPFKKYDQVLVPDFLYGAMENAAAITFSEQRFLHNAKATAEQKQRLASVIMHEMAHQWFGNLVTMKWWNGLWLNESFAAFMGTLATAEATEFSHAWRSFYSKGKLKAYHQDSLVTTHPIEVPVATTHNAFDNIGAITYSKGASTLSQLNHLLGRETFRRGVNQYLTQYSYKNAELDDFIGSLGQAAGKDLNQWSQEWLYKAGVNTLSVDWQCENNTISKIDLLQRKASDSLPTLRTQKVQLALFSNGRREMHLNRSIAVTYSGARTSIKALIGSPCPDLIYPNYQDWGYAKVELDDASFKTAQTRLIKFKDPLLRAMLWQSLWDSVTSGKTALNDYLGAVFINAPQETDYTMLRQVVDNMLTAKDSLVSMAPSHLSYTQRAIKGLQQMSLRKAMEFQHQRDFQILWFEAYIELANNLTTLDHLKQLLIGEAHINGIEISQDLRWKIIKQLNRYDTLSAKRLLNEEQQKDMSDTGQKAALAAQIIRPEAANKRLWLRKISQGSTMPFAKTRVAMQHLYPAEQQLLSRATAEQRLSDLPALDASKGPVFMRAYANSLIPKACTHANIEAIEQLLKRNTKSQPSRQLSSISQRALIEAQQDELQCVKMKQAMYLTK